MVGELGDIRWLQRDGGQKLSYFMLAGQPATIGHRYPRRGRPQPFSVNPAPTRVGPPGLIPSNR